VEDSVEDFIHIFVLSLQSVGWSISS